MDHFQATDLPDIADLVQSIQQNVDALSAFEYGIVSTQDAVTACAYARAIAGVATTICSIIAPAAETVQPNAKNC